MDFQKEHGYQFPVLPDPQGSLATQYRITGVPTLIVIDSKGEVSRTLVGVKPSAEDLVRLAEEAG